MRKFLIGLSIFLGAVLVLVILGAVILDHFLDRIKVIDPAVQGTVSQWDAESIRQDAYETIGQNDTLPSVEATAPAQQPGAQGEHVVNILLIGQDRRAGQGTQRSDSMILVTFNKNTGVIALTSIMRDQLVHIPGYGSDKLNHAYQYGGMELLDQVLLDHYGIRVDGNVEVDFSGFQEIVDLLGGVEIELTEKEAEHLNKVWGGR